MEKSENVLCSLPTNLSYEGVSQEQKKPTNHITYLCYVLSHIFFLLLLFSLIFHCFLFDESIFETTLPTMVLFKTQWYSAW